MAQTRPVSLQGKLQGGAARRTSYQPRHSSLPPAMEQQQQQRRSSSIPPMQRPSLASARSDDMDDASKAEFPLSKREALADRIPAERRECTDVLWLFVFLAYFAGMVVLAVLASQTGDPWRLVYGKDHRGILCGGEDEPDKRFVAYPRTNDDLFLAGFTGGDSVATLSSIEFFGVCVEECPQAGDFVCTQAGEDAVQALVDSGKGSRDGIIYSCLNQWYQTLPFGQLCPDKVVRAGCFETLSNTTSVFFRCLPKYRYETETLPESGCIRYRNVTTVSGTIKRYCVMYKEVTKVTREQPTASNLLFDTFNTYTALASGLMGDLVKAYKPVLISGFGVSFGIGLLYVFSLWCCVGVVVWVTVVLAMLTSLAFTLYCYLKAGMLSDVIVSDLYNTVSSFLSTATAKLEDAAVFVDLVDPDTNETLPLSSDSESALPDAFTASLRYTQEFTYAAYFMTGFTILLCLIVFSLLERISRAIRIFGIASKAIRRNIFLVLVPFVSMAFFIAVIFSWSIATAFVASAGTFELKQLNQTFSVALPDPDETALEVQSFNSWDYGNVYLAYMFFGLLWILNFLNAMTVMSLSGAVLRWFWADRGPGHEDDDRNTAMPILRSFYVVLRYHLGTIAFGSLVLAFFQFIRYLAAYLQRRMNHLQKNNRVLQILFCAVHCFLACVQWCVEFVTRNAFIMCAMYGGNFCSSSRQAFVAIASNLAQVALITFLGEIIQRFGQLLITLLAGLSCWVYLDYFPEYGFGGELQLNSFVFPVVMSMLIAWFVSAEVLSVYDVAVDTILLSFCQDRRLRFMKPGHHEMATAELKGAVRDYRLRGSRDLREARENTIY